MSRACHAAQAGQAGSSSPYGFAITPSGECCIRCNSAYLPVVAERVPELMRGHLPVACFSGAADEHLADACRAELAAVAGPQPHPVRIGEPVAAAYPQIDGERPGAGR